VNFNKNKGLYLPDFEFGRKKHGISKRFVTLMCLLGVLLGLIALGAGPTQIRLGSQTQGVLPSNQGGTGSTVVGFTGPTVSRSFTLPDTNATLEWQANKNVASGYAGLDSNSLVLPAQLPTFSTTLKGAVPASGGGTTSFLRADGTWAAPPSTTINFLDQQTPTGTVNGVNSAFTTSQSCIASSLLL
jgi:hypothetical protein